MKTMQMELGLAVAAVQLARNAQNSHTYSNWWFQQMRKAVDMAGGFGSDAGRKDSADLLPKAPSVLMQAQTF